MICDSKLSDWVKNKAVAVFHRVAVAEGKVHGMPPEEVHFHEVGAVDSIVDIVGACIALDLLGRPQVLSSPVVEGRGWVDCAHGRFPVPTTATLEILAARGIGISQCDEPHELVTPTGAALLAEFAGRFETMQHLRPSRIGYGLGTRNLASRPNVLRAVLGEAEVETSAHESGHDWEHDEVAELQTNLDDISAELLGHFVEQVLALGALEVFHTPIQMKKNRPGILLTILCQPDQADAFTERVMRETTSFGVRRSLVSRRKLRRDTMTVQTEHGAVILKLGKLNGKIIHLTPEYESCRRLAASIGLSLQEVYRIAVRAGEKKLASSDDPNTDRPSPNELPTGATKPQGSVHKD